MMVACQERFLSWRFRADGGHGQRPLSVAICSILGLQSLISLNDNGGLGCGHSLSSTAITGSGSGSERGFQRGSGLGDGRGLVGLGLGGWSGFS